MQMRFKNEDRPFQYRNSYKISRKERIKLKGHKDVIKWKNRYQHRDNRVNKENKKKRMK